MNYMNYETYASRRNEILTTDDMARDYGMDVGRFIFHLRKIGVMKMIREDEFQFTVDEPYIQKAKIMVEGQILFYKKLTKNKVYPKGV